MSSLLVSRQAAASELLARRRARASLIDFTTYTKPDFTVGEHHKQIAEALESVERGECDRLMIFAPPRHTKSELASRRFPAWYLGRHPDRQLIAATYSGDFALDFGRDVRGIVQGEEFKALFPDVSLAADSQAANRWHTNHGGVSVYVGVGGPITGRGAHCALIDDPFKNREEADSEVRRETVWKWYTSTLRTRLMPGGAIVLILTRWHEDDLAGRLLELQRGEWNVIELPAIRDEGQPHERALWPEWYDLAALKRIRSDIGPRDWSALYQQRPTPDEGTYFQRDWFRWYDTAPKHLNRYICSDYAVSEGGGDWTEHGVFGIDPDDNLYILDWWSGQTAADVWIETLLDMVGSHKPFAAFGESGVIRKAVEPYLTRRARERKEFCRLEWITRTGDKAAMARGFQARASMGKVYLPKGKPWAEDLLRQLLTFPAGRHDDKVDVCALMGMALDQAHPAIVQRDEAKKPLDRWDKAFGEHDDVDDWKTV
jgi:predicted phage terminase large subunit-like protein